MEAKRLSVGVTLGLVLGLLSSVCLWRGSAPLPADAGLIRDVKYSSPRKEALIRTGKSYIAPLAGREPVIDGLLQDACWKDAGSIGGMLLFKSADRSPQVSTDYKLSFDRKALYIAVRAEEPRMSALKVDQLQSGTAAIWHDDCIELWFDIWNEGRQSYHLLVNPAGAVFTQREWEEEIQDPLAVEAGVRTLRLQRDDSWRPQVKSSVVRSKDHWTVELALPAAALGLQEILPGSIWGFNAARTRRAGGSEELSSWTGVYVSPIASFGTLQLGEPSLIFSVTDRGQMAAGHNLLSLMMENRGCQKEEVIIETRVLSGRRRLADRRNVLLPGQAKTLSLPYYLRPDIKSHNMEIIVIGAATGETIFRQSFTGELPDPLQFSALSRQIYLGEEKSIRVGISCLIGDVSLKEHALSLEILREGKVVAQDKLSALKNSMMVLELDITGLRREGRYRVQAVLLDRHGRRVAVAGDELVILESPF